MVWKGLKAGFIGRYSGMAVLVCAAFLFTLYGTSGKSNLSALPQSNTAMRTESAPLTNFSEAPPGLLGQPSEFVASLMPPENNDFPLSAELPHPVQVTVGGKTTTLYSNQQTVIGVLRQFHISLGSDDKVTPFLYSYLPDTKARINIVRVRKVDQVRQEAIVFKTVTQNDPNLLKGKQKIIRQGRNGVLQKTFEKIFENGKLVAQNLIGTAVQTDSVDQVVAVGTAKPVVALSVSTPEAQEVTKNDLTFGVKKVLSNVILTAYSAGPASTGKSQGDPQFGITYTGARVKQGETVAVDPKVIPLGWWIYIDGYGFRKAEDIGSGVKGKWIDIYYDSPQVVRQFGMKRGVTVYVIGPKKPAAD